MRGQLGRAVDWAFRDRTTGRIVVAQTPNAPLLVFLAATIADRVLDPEGAVGTVVQVVSTGALLVWAGDEVLRGVNPFRRGLGAVVATATVAGLIASALR